MYDAKINILFVANGFLITFIREEKLIKRLMVKYGEEEYVRLKRIIGNIQVEQEFSEAKLTIKRGVGSKDVDRVLDTLKEAGIQILCIHEATSIPHNGCRNIITTKKGNNNGK